MKQFKVWAGALGAALLVAACGGGDGTSSGNPIGITSLVTFGDSLSDAGTYAVGTISAPASLGGGGGGRYTVNSGTSTPAKIWVDLIASQLALPAPCAAVTGLDGAAMAGLSVPFSKPAGCTNYAQGGSRVTMEIGPGHKSNPEVSGTSIVYKAATLGQLTYPVKDQIADHLSRPGSGGVFHPKALVTVLAGGNDVFIQSNVATAAGVVQAMPNATTIGNFSNIATTAGGWTNDQVLAVLGGTAIGDVLNANMAKAGTELANLVKNEIVGKGAKQVLVVNLPNVGATPLGVSTRAIGGDVLATNMAKAFNNALSTGLAGVPGVVIVDAFTTSTDQFNNPTAYGLTKAGVETRSCKNDSTNILAGSSLVCNPTNVISGDLSTYAFADDVHPSPLGHKLLAQLVAKTLAAAGWL